MSNSNHQVSIFALVFLFTKEISNIEGAEIKKILNPKKDEKTTFFEDNSLKLKFFSLDEARLGVSIEGAKVIFSDGNIEKYNFKRVKDIVEKMTSKLKANKIKALGFNFDVIFSAEKKFYPEDLLSEKVMFLTKEFKVAKFGTKIALQESDNTQINITIDSGIGKENSLVSHFNFHEDTDKFPNINKLFISVDKKFKQMMGLLASLEK